MTASEPPLLLNATKDLARFAAELKFEQIPAAVIEHLKLSILDSIGVCLHGVTLPWTRHVQALVEAEDARAEASIFGSGKKTSAANAVLVNSTAGHAFELDDIHKESIIHPGSLALPVALALAEAKGGASGRDLITAIVAGYEVGARVGNAATVQLLLDGFHPQGTSGAFVAAAAAARVLGLDPIQTLHCLGIVGSQAGGLMAANGLSGARRRAQFTRAGRPSHRLARQVEPGASRAPDDYFFISGAKPSSACSRPGMSHCSSMVWGGTYSAKSSASTSSRMVFTVSEISSTPISSRRCW